MSPKSTATQKLGTQPKGGAKTPKSAKNTLPTSVDYKHVNDLLMAGNQEAINQAANMIHDLATCICSLTQTGKLQDDFARMLLAFLVKTMESSSSGMLDVQESTTTHSLKRSFTAAVKQQFEAEASLQLCSSHLQVLKEVHDAIFVVCSIKKGPNQEARDRLVVSLRHLVDQAFKWLETHYLAILKEEHTRGLLTTTRGMWEVVQSKTSLDDESRKTLREALEKLKALKESSALIAPPPAASLKRCVAGAYAAVQEVSEAEVNPEPTQKKEKKQKVGEAAATSEKVEEAATAEKAEEAATAKKKKKVKAATSEKPEEAAATPEKAEKPAKAAKPATAEKKKKVKAVTSEKAEEAAATPEKPEKPAKAATAEKKKKVKAATSGEKEKKGKGQPTKKALMAKVNSAWSAVFDYKNKLEKEVRVPINGYFIPKFLNYLEKHVVPESGNHKTALLRLHEKLRTSGDTKTRVLNHLKTIFAHIAVTHPKVAKAYFSDVAQNLVLYTKAEEKYDVKPKVDGSDKTKKPAAAKKKGTERAEETEDEDEAGNGDEESEEEAVSIEDEDEDEDEVELEDEDEEEEEGEDEEEEV